MKRVRIEKAGPYVDVVVYPVAKGRSSRAERIEAVKCTSDLRQKMNDRTSANKFRRLIAANFKPSDYVVTLTYSDETLPTTPELARDKRLKPCICQLRHHFKSLSVGPLKYMYVTEGLHGDQRLHHHIIIPNIPNIKETIRGCWPHGHVNFETISPRGYEVWASYLTKEPRKTGRRRVGDRAWTPSIGLKKPEVIIYDVQDDYRYEPPFGVVITHNEDVQTEWFRCQFISYYKPDYLIEN